ncbi:uncharacterized protein LOC115223291 [Octopus sinensis]|uniref:Uncharacterized protein LOC115223291 n=1 Tax=Octopus sinensis TaxID=2607531 RepID=A0A6P7THK3_9MOLL|nr:uncharacterized protein LOC115223291 [Octopus sinensis]
MCFPCCNLSTKQTSNDSNSVVTWRGLFKNTPVNLNCVLDMEVRIKFGKHTESIYDVNIRDDCRPRVGEASTSSETVVMEPAIWFKCLVISYIHLDCDLRRIKFRKSFRLCGGGVPLEAETEETLQGSNTLCSHYRFSEKSIDATDYAECYDFECFLDELFDQAIECLNNFRRKEITLNQFHSHVLRLLHCFVFPSIKFTTCDLPLLLQSQDYIHEQLSNIEKAILKQDKLVFQTESSLRSQRERLFRTESFHKESYIRHNCKSEFLEILLKDVERDIFKHDKLLDECQRKINDLKASRSQNVCTLQIYRKDRDVIHQQLTNLENIRENIKNVIVRPALKKKKIRRKKLQKNVFHDIYNEVYKKLLEQKEKLQNQCFNKVKMVTVREAITMSIRDIQSVGETLGIDVKIDGSERATDILDVNEKPDYWKTHNEKIAHILANPKETAHKIHVRFCSNIRDRINAFIDENVMFNFGTLKKDTSTEFWISPAELSILNQNTITTHRRRNFTYNSLSNSPDSLSYQSVNSIELPELDDGCCSNKRQSILSDCFKTIPMKSSLDIICSDIKSHMQNMTYQILPPLLLPEDISPAKLWLIYESHLYLNIMDDILYLYSTAYGSQCQKLISNIANFSVTEFVTDDDFVQHLFSKCDMYDSISQVDSGKSSSNSSEEEEILNTGNFRLSTSLEDLKWRGSLVRNLYKRADEECSNLMESLDISAQSTSLQSSVDSDESFMARLSANPRPQEPVRTEIYLAKPSRNSQYNTLKFKQLFTPALVYLDNLSITSSIVAKLRCLTRMFHCLNSTISTLCSVDNKQYCVCSDEILTVAILMLVMLVEPQKLKTFYINLLVIVDLMAPCLIGGIHDCSLTTFYSAFQFISDRIFLMTQKR